MLPSVCRTNGADRKELSMDARISETQLKILRHIAQSIDLTGCQPSYRDICEVMGYASPNAVHGHIEALAKKGLVKKRGARAIEFDWRLFAGARG